MKLVLQVAFSIFLFFINISAKAQTLDNPVAYMDAISKAQLEMNQRYMAYISAAAHGRRAKKVEKLRQQAIESITNSRYKTIEIPIYKGDNSLRQSSIEYIQFCYKIFNEDYAHIVNMEEIAEQSVDRMQEYLLLQEKTDEKLNEASNKMTKAEKDFAAKYNVTLIEGKSELGEKMTIAEKVNHYSNKIFIIFFKANWEDNELTKAMNNKKLNDAEQARNALLNYANEGLQELTSDSLRSFQGDPSMAVTCKKLLQFYKKTAETDAPKMIDFFLKQENFNKIQKAMDAKSTRTKEDVDVFNKAVKEINAGVNQFNQLNQLVNNTRSQLIQDWDNNEKNFKDTHMPYYK